MSVFRESVLTVVSRIPKGSVMSYGEVARRAGSPGASRAVGRIMASNVDPLIPCHRVVRSDGGLGGYNRGGISQKKKLLQSEGVLMHGGRLAVSM
ncbi:MAG: MGMT family protein [Candidatus Kaiserbacteria bacterium]|nr:MGMT family protein [Candidatus Kaiserbacteria bacterium]